MVDILKRGTKLPEDKLLIEKCLKCRSVIRWRRSEGSIASDPNTKVKTSVIKCPECGTMVSCDL